MSIKCRGWHGNAAGAPGVDMAKLVSELLKTVSFEVVFII